MFTTKHLCRALLTLVTIASSGAQPGDFAGLGKIPIGIKSVLSVCPRSLISFALALATLLAPSAAASDVHAATSGVSTPTAIEPTKPSPVKPAATKTPLPGGAAPSSTSIKASSTAANAPTASTVVLDPPTRYQTGQNPHGLVIGDLTGSGRRDVITVNVQGTFSVFLNNGDGSLRPPVQYSAPGARQFGALGDFRGVGKPDLVLTAPDLGRISIFRNNGDGTFQAPVNIPATGNPNGVGVGDFNGDGKLDIITANGGTGDVSVFLGRGDGTFEAPINTYAGHGNDGRGLAIGDFNRDGKLDVAVANGYSPGADPATFSVLLGNGAGGFGPPQVVAIGNTYQTTTVMGSADLNRDANLDIVAGTTGCGYGGSDISVALGPSFQPPLPLGDGCDAWVAAGDMNGDGIPDLVTANYTGTFDDHALVKVHLGKGDGTFQAPQVVSLSPDRDPRFLALADLKGDGKLDIITANYNSQNITVLLNRTAPPPPGSLTIPESNGDENRAERHCRCAQDRVRRYPINAATGNFYHTFVDITIPGRGIPLAFSHTYNSTSAATDGPLGFGWTSSYGNGMSLIQSGNTVRIVQENGAEVTFTLAGGTYSAPPRVTATLVKNADGTFTFVRNARERFTFSVDGRLNQEQDLNGYTTAFGYNSSGQLATITDPSNRTLTLAWTGTHISSVTDSTGRIVRFGYDGQGSLSDVTDVNGGITRFTYDANHLLQTMTGPRGGIVTTHYDASNRVDWQTDPLNRKTTLAYTGNNMMGAGGTTTITDPKGNVTVETYQYGLRTQVTKGSGTPSAATWKYTYDQATLGITSITDPNGHVSSMTYDGSGNLLITTDALGRQTVNTYNAFNEVLTSQDPNGVTTTMTYDGNGNLKTTSRPLVGTSQNQVTTLVYGDPSHPGDVTSMIDPNGKTWTYGYDTYGNRSSTTDPVGNRSTTTYNSIGWKLTSVTPKGNTTTYGYTDAVSGLNKFGDVITITDPLGHVTTRHYDADRHVDRLTDPDGNTTSFEYNLADELTVITRADGTKVRTTYNPDGTLLQQIDGSGAATTYDYDSLARATSVSDPLGRITRATYDKAGNRLTIVDPQSQTTTFTYDAANQLRGITYSDGVTPNVSNLTYDNNGHRLTMTDGSGTSSWTFDSLNRMTSSRDGAGNTIGYAYDLKGQLTSLTYPANTTVTRTFDDAGRLSRVQDWLGNANTFAYDADSNLVGQTFPLSTGLTDTFAFDAADRLMGITNTRGTVTYASHTYGRDANNQLTSTLSTGMPEPTERSFAYTPLNQLRTVDGATFSYDPADNITTLAYGASLTYDAANQLKSLTDGNGTTQFTYDPRGNRTQTAPPATVGPASTFTYDQANRLTSIGPGPVVSYTYNGDGLRMSKTFGTVGSPDYFVEQFAWAVAEGLPLLLTDADVNYVYGPGGLPLEEIAADGTVLYYHHDQLGSTRLLTDATGAVAVSYTYDAYGNTTGQIGSDVNSFGYAGEYNDSESGLYYLRARYYDPATGQFITRDPVAGRNGNRIATSRVIRSTGRTRPACRLA